MASKKPATDMVLRAGNNLPPEYQDLSREELETLIAQVTLEQQLLELDRIKDESNKRVASKEALVKYNAQIQQAMSQEAAMMASFQKRCRHRMGGQHKDPYSGDGRPCVVRTQMLDGYTYLLQCTRCRLKVFTPHPSLKKSDPERYQQEREVYDKLLQMSIDSQLDEIRGPSFTFERDGVPFIPERV
jgi:hypothetical protein